MRSEGQFGAAAEALAAHATAVQIGTMGPEAARAVKEFTLDTIGVGIGGAGSVYARRIADLVGRWGSAADGGGRAAIFGFSREVAPAQAAFANAFLAHCQEFDCVHEAAVLHPFTVVIPALLADAATRTLDGATFIAAASAGVDVAAGLGVAATSQIRFFRPATCGVFGAVAALARARGLSQAQTVDAFGFALALAAGTMQAHVEGTPALAVSVGAAARSALAAVDLAEAGLPGPRGSIDGPFGYLSLFETTSSVDRLLAGLASPRVLQVSWKPFPTGRAAHGGIDMTLRLHADGLTAENLAEFTIEAPPLIAHLVGRPVVRPLEVNYARLCLPYAAACALVHGGVGLEDFTPTRLADERVLALAERITVQVADNPDPAAFTPQRAAARLKDGRTLEAALQILPGSRARPLSESEQVEKFLRCWRFARGQDRDDQAQALIRTLRDLDQMSDIRELGRLASDL